ncbi:hypothetical protein [Micromonospora sp. NPDC005305]|uniref:hypothetical protein n=1 Tax=Micromonospora sp. NPDC005305 TaxID=3156875 RepID=UPI0033A33A3C
MSLLLGGPNGERAVHPVTRTADGWVVAVDDIRTPGTWRVGVTVLRDGLPPVTDTHLWPVPDGDSTATPVRVSAAPLRPALDRSALAFGVAAVVGVVIVAGWWWRRRRPAGRDGDQSLPADTAAPAGRLGEPVGVGAEVVSSGRPPAARRLRGGKFTPHRRPRDPNP